jgi:hypothetical protein
VATGHAQNSNRRPKYLCYSCQLLGQSLHVYWLAKWLATVAGWGQHRCYGPHDLPSQLPAPTEHWLVSVILDWDVSRFSISDMGGYWQQWTGFVCHQCIHHERLRLTLYYGTNIGILIMRYEGIRRLAIKKERIINSSACEWFQKKKSWWHSDWVWVPPAQAQQVSSGFLVLKSQANRGCYAPLPN